MTKKTIKKATKSVVKKLRAKKDPTLIEREGYFIKILKAEDEKALTEIQNTGKVIGVIRFDDNSSSITNDEIVVAYRK